MLAHWIVLLIQRFPEFLFKLHAKLGRKSRSLFFTWKPKLSSFHITTEKLRFGQKPFLLETLESNLPDQDAVLSPNVEVKIIVSVVLVNLLKHTPRATFDEYAAGVFVKYVQNEISDVARFWFGMKQIFGQ